MHPKLLSTYAVSQKQREGSRTWFFFLLLFSLSSLHALADSTLQDEDSREQDPDPFFLQPKPSSASGTADQLLDEAQQLFLTQRPIDARSKLLNALQVAPQDYRVHMLLGTYYLSEVAHFRLAYRYLQTAQTLFEKQFGSDLTNNLAPEAWKQNAKLLSLISEVQLNLDQYDVALKTLERYGKVYWDDWYPGSLAWVLMKLKRVDDGIRVAQSGLLRGAEPGKTFNILGILLSLKGSREISLDAFAQAIKAELSLGGSGQVATPLNNSGEVYRELFQDDRAEAAWIKALQLADGCEHILPSLNLTILYIDQLRLFQASRVLDDFQACFANHAGREDTEHRTLLALARGKIALRTGDVDQAIEHLGRALERKQWFGKIGTNENDVRFAATIALAQAFSAKAHILPTRAHKHWWGNARDMLQAPWFKLRAWWLQRRAREIALDELSSLEDLLIRNTDTMTEYPTFGPTFAGFPEKSFQARIKRLLKRDTRKRAASYYQLYLGTNLLEHRKPDEAIKLFEEARRGFRPIDRLAQAQVLTQLLLAQDRKKGFWQKNDDETELKLLQWKTDLFSMFPPNLLQYGIALPVIVQNSASTKPQQKILDKISTKVISRAFVDMKQSSLSASVPFLLSIGASAGTAAKHTGTEGNSQMITLALRSRKDSKIIVSESAVIQPNGKGSADLINKFIAKTFHHRVDPPPEPVPTEGVLFPSSSDIKE